MPLCLSVNTPSRYVCTYILVFTSYNWQQSDLKVPSFLSIFSLIVMPRHPCMGALNPVWALLHSNLLVPLLLQAADHKIGAELTMKANFAAFAGSRVWLVLRTYIQSGTNHRRTLETSCQANR